MARQDADVKQMSDVELRAEVMKLRRAIRKHKRAEGNARCWHNDLKLYGALPEGTPPGRMTGDPRLLFRNCRAYIRRQQCKEVRRGCQ